MGGVGDANCSERGVCTGGGGVRRWTLPSHSTPLSRLRLTSASADRLLPSPLPLLCELPQEAFTNWSYSIGIEEDAQKNHHTFGLVLPRSQRRVLSQRYGSPPLWLTPEVEVPCAL